VNPRHVSVTIASCLVFAASTVSAQGGGTPNSPPATPGFEFSGQMFGNWQIKSDSASKANLGGKAPNLFDLGRAYLNRVFGVNFTLYNKELAEAGRADFLASGRVAEDCWTGEQKRHADAT